MGDGCKVLMISHRWVLDVGCWMLMISHRGISVITPLPFGGGDGGGATTCFEPCVFCSSVSSVRKRMFLREQKNVPPWEKELFSVSKRMSHCERKNVPL